MILSGTKSEKPTTSVEAGAWAPATPKPPWPWLVSALLASVTAILVLPTLGDPGIWLDEAFTVANSRTDLLEIARLNGGNMVGYYALMNPLAQPPLDGAFWLRFPSAVAAIAAPVALYRLAMLLLPHRLAVGAGLIFAAHPVLIIYGQEARSYAIAVLLSICAWYAFIRLVDSEGQRRWVIVLVLATSTGGYFHLLTLFNLPAQLATLVFLGRRAPWRAMACATATVAALVAPLVYWALSPSSGGPGWMSPLSLNQFVSVLNMWALSSNTLGRIIWLGAMAVGLVMSLRLSARPSDSLTSWRLAIPGIWLLGPIALVALVSLVQPLMAYRYLMFTLPGFILLAMLALRHLHAWVQVAGIAVLLSISASMTIQILGQEQADVWRDATCSLREADADDLIIFHQRRDRTPVDVQIEIHPECTPAASVHPDGRWGEPRRTYPPSWSDGTVARLPERTWLVWWDLSLTERFRTAVHVELEAAGITLADEQLFGSNILIEQWTRD